MMNIQLVFTYYHYQFDLLDCLRFSYRYNNKPMSQGIPSKQLSAVNFAKRVKSPYTLQYLQFEERLNGKKPKTRLPNMPTISKKDLPPPLSTEDYLELANHLRFNRAKISINDDKENLFPTLDPANQTMTIIKDKISRIKSKKSEQLRPQTLQQSQELTKAHRNIQPQVTEGSNARSRVQSEFLGPKKNKEQSGPITFLMYKKSKRELSTRFRP